MISKDKRFLMSVFFSSIFLYYAIEFYNRNKKQWKNKQK